MKFDESFNWLAVLKDLAAGMPLIEEDRIRLMMLATSWPTCACGQLCKKLPRGYDGRPEDYRLTELGKRFSVHIIQSEWKPAMHVFRQIEARTDELLKCPQ